MTWQSLQPVIRSAARAATLPRFCEAGPSRLRPSAVRPQVLQKSLFSSSTGRSADGDVDKQHIKLDDRDPYSISEDFVRNAAQENEADGKLAGGQDVGYSYSTEDAAGDQSKRFLDALTAAIPDSPPARGRSTKSDAEEVTARGSAQQPASDLYGGSITSRLTKTWYDSKPLAARPRRIPRGIHQKHKRLQGMTPTESEAIAELLKPSVNPAYYPFGSFGDETGGGYGSSRGSSGAYGFGASYAERGNAFGLYGGGHGLDAYSSKAIRARRRLTERPDDPDREIIDERLQELKEDAMAGQTDVDLLHWAKRRVFVQEKLPDGSTGFHPVYPHALAFLLDTLRRRFQSPHLVLTVFAYAQNHSPESYIAGCLAPAYNEVLWAKWESFRDIQGVEQTIREMEANGVKWDKGTYQVVNEVAEIVGKDVYDRGLAKRWGENVFEILANLDRKAASDVDQQEQIYELQKKEKARKRQERTMMEYQQRRGGVDMARWDV